MKRETRVYEALPGDEIFSTVKEMSRLARENNETVTGEFNDQQLLVRPDDDPDDVVEIYWAECKRRREEYEKSPEGIAASKAQVEYQEEDDAAAAEGILPFSIKDKEGWQKCVEINTDPCGSCGVRYAARWANYMEKELSSGAKLVDIADKCSSAADIEGITGFMYGCAVSLLAAVWEYGEELRRWHNLATQIKDEGEKANKSGGVLNPAILSIGGAK